MNADPDPDSRNFKCGFTHINTTGRDEKMMKRCRGIIWCNLLPYYALWDE